MEPTSLPSRCSGLLRLLPGALLLGAGVASAAQPLALGEAERIAVEQAPAIEGFRSRAEGARQAAYAAGALPDPELTLGAMALPVDDPGLDTDPMSRLEVGLRQRFPAGRGAARERVEAQAETAAAQAEEAARAVRRQTRKAYLELLHRQRAIALLRESRSRFEALVEAAEREVAADRASRQDRLQAILELERLEDRIDRERIALDDARARLARWIGEAAARRPLAQRTPELAPPPKPAAAAERLAAHPRLAAEEARVGIGQARLREARAGYRPDWGIEVSYGHRRAERMDGSAAPDLFSVMVSMQLPLFPGNRQDRDVAAGQRRVAAAQAERREARLELRRDLEATYARWERLGQRQERYEKRLIPLATDNAEAALAAYRADTVAFTALQQARVAALEMRLSALRVEIQRLKAQAELLYLTGGGSS